MGTESSKCCCLYENNIESPREINDLVQKGFSALLDFAVKSETKVSKSQDEIQYDEGYASTTIYMSTLDTLEIMTCMRSSLVKQQLANCKFDDSFINTLKKRVSVLKSAYRTMVQKEAIKSIELGIMSISQTRSPEIQSNTQAELQLGIEAVCAFLAYMSLLKNEQQTDFLEQILPLLDFLKPMQLSPSHLTNSPHACTSNLSNVVVTSLRDFLYSMASPKHVPDDILADDAANEMQIQSAAADALICLTSARGCTSDLLLLVHLLLKVGTWLINADRKKKNVVTDLGLRK